MQLGRIGEALLVLLKHAKLEDLAPCEQKAIDDLNGVLKDVAKVKERHKAPHIIWPDEQGYRRVSRYVV
jgi:hypothetical protein